MLHCISACCSSVSKVDSFEIRLPGLLKTSSAVLHVLYPPIRAHHEYAVQSAEKFMADLLAIVASTQDSEDQQIAAAKKLSTAYAADLRAWMGRWVGKVSGDHGFMSVHKAIVEEQNRHSSESRAWRVLQAAELVIGDEKTNLRPSAGPRPSRSSISPRGGRFPGAGPKTR